MKFVTRVLVDRVKCRRNDWGYSLLFLFFRERSVLRNLDLVMDWITRFLKLPYSEHECDLMELLLVRGLYEILFLSNNEFFLVEMYSMSY